MEVKKCRLEDCGVTRGRGSVGQEWKNLCGMSKTIVSGRQLGFSSWRKRLILRLLTGAAAL